MKLIRYCQLFLGLVGFLCVIESVTGHIVSVSLSSDGNMVYTSFVQFNTKHVESLWKKYRNKRKNENPDFHVVSF